MENVQSDALIGHWVHSHEEDSGPGKVFRPADRPLPPSRGRQEYRLNPGGELIATGPGPTDRRQTVQGTWALDGNVLVLHLPYGDMRFQVVSVESDRLILAPQNP